MALESVELRWLVDWRGGHTFIGPLNYHDLKASGLWWRGRVAWGSEDTGGTYRSLTGASGVIELRDRAGLFDPSNTASPFYDTSGEFPRNLAEFRHRLRVVRTDTNQIVWQGWMYPPDDLQNSRDGIVTFLIGSAAREELRSRMAPVASLATTAVSALRKVGTIGPGNVRVRDNRAVPPYSFGQLARGNRGGISRREYIKRIGYATAMDSYEDNYGQVWLDPIDTPSHPVSIDDLDIEYFDLDSTTRRPITDVEIKTVSTTVNTTGFQNIGRTTGGRDNTGERIQTALGDPHDTFASPLANAARWGRRSGAGFRGTVRYRG